MAHHWKQNKCVVCQLSRRSVRGRWAYTQAGKDRFTETCPPCKDGQISLFDRVGPSEPEGLATELLPPVVAVKRVQSGAIAYDRPVRDQTPIEYRVNDYLVLEMDPDGEWGGREADWRVGVILPPNYNPPAVSQVSFRDTLPVALREAEGFMRRYRSMSGAQVYACDGVHTYMWLSPSLNGTHGVAARWTLAR